VSAMTRLFIQSRARPPVTPAFQARASLPGLPPVAWTQSEAGAQKSEAGSQEYFSTISTLDTKSMNAGIAILAFRVREVWQSPCPYPYVRERTHAEDLDH
jgi:hypothetical protein